MNESLGKYWFLDNDYTLKEPVIYGRLFFWSITNAILAASTEDINLRIYLSKCTPQEAKALNLEARKDLGVVLKEFLHAKFSNKELRGHLLETPDDLLSPTLLLVKQEIINGTSHQNQP